MLHTLYNSTARKDDGQDSLDSVMGIYLDALSGYPADILSDALLSAPRQSKWFPALYDLYQTMDWRRKQREVILYALEHPFEPDKLPERESAESRAKHVSEVMDKMNDR